MLTDISDFIPYRHLSNKALEICNMNPQAAKIVYLNLSRRFRAMPV